MIDETEQFILTRRAATQRSALAGDPKQAIKALELIARESTLTSSRITKLGDFSLDDLFNQEPRKKTGVTVIDELLRGGTVDGELYGVLAKPGGGKSTLAYSLIAKGAKEGRHVALFSSEEAGHPVYDRITISAAGVDRAYVENRNSKDIPVEIFKKLKKAKEAIGPYVHLVDFTSCTGGAPALIQDVEEMISNGEKPELVVLDWYGDFISKSMMNSKQSSDASTLRLEMGKQMGILSAAAKQLQIPMFIMHQLAKSEARKKPKHISSFLDAQDGKLFGDLLNYVFVFGAADPQEVDGRLVDICWLALSKARSLPKKNKIVMIDGSRCIIKNPTQNFVVSSYGDGFECITDDVASKIGSMI